MRIYDDELRIFLSSVLKKIDYLKNIPDEIIAHIALSMEVARADKDQVIHYEQDATNRQSIVEMKIIYTGQMSLSITLDNKIEAMVDCVGKGTILNAHNFLSNRTHHMTIKCLNSCIYYYLPYSAMVRVAQLYPELAASLKEA